MVDHNVWRGESIPGNQLPARSVEDARGHVVVIDDAPELREVYRELLTEELFVVAAYRCDEVDMAMLRRLAPDLIVLDGLRPGHAAG